MELKVDYEKECPHVNQLINQKFNDFKKPEYQMQAIKQIFRCSFCRQR